MPNITNHEENTKGQKRNQEGDIRSEWHYEPAWSNWYLHNSSSKNSNIHLPFKEIQNVCKIDHMLVNKLELSAF